MPFSCLCSVGPGAGSIGSGGRGRTSDRLWRSGSGDRSGLKPSDPSADYSGQQSHVGAMRCHVELGRKWRPLLGSSPLSMSLDLCQAGERFSTRSPASFYRQTLLDKFAANAATSGQNSGDSAYQRGRARNGHAGQNARKPNAGFERVWIPNERGYPPAGFWCPTRRLLAAALGATRDGVLVCRRITRR